MSLRSHPTYILQAQHWYVQGNSDEQTEDADLQARFAPLAQELADNEAKIVEELNAVQGQPVDLGGYYCTDEEKTAAVMRPSATFNATLAAFA